MKYLSQISQCPVVRRMLDAVNKGRQSHAYLISCEDAYTSGVVGALLIAGIIGNADVKRVYDGLYADVMIFPEEGKDKVLSPDVDAITSTAHITPTELDKKFYVIKMAETMNDSAQNKLLKTLEEAPPSAVIVLECATPAVMLPTILSRCVKIEIPPMDFKMIRQGLEGLYGEDERIYPAVGLSRGYFGFAEKVITEKAYYESYKLALETLVFMKTSRNILSYSAKWMAKKENLLQILDCVAVILDDCMLLSAGRAEDVKLKSNMKEISELSRQYDYRVASLVIPLISEAKRTLSYNCSAQAVVDGLLFSILEVKAKCQKSLE